MPTDHQSTSRSSRLTRATSEVDAAAEHADLVLRAFDEALADVDMEAVHSSEFARVHVDHAVRVLRGERAATAHLLGAAVAHVAALQPRFERAQADHDVDAAEALLHELRAIVEQGDELRDRVDVLDTTIQELEALLSP